MGSLKGFFKGSFGAQGGFRRFPGLKALVFRAQVVGL